MLFITQACWQALAPLPPVPELELPLPLEVEPELVEPELVEPELVDPELVEPWLLEPELVVWLLEVLPPVALVPLPQARSIAGGATNAKSLNRVRWLACIGESLSTRRKKPREGARALTAS